MFEPILAAIPLPALQPIAGQPPFVWVGAAMALLLAWQALTGLRVIKLGRRFRTIHRATGLTTVALMLFHIPYALQAMGII